MASPKQKAKVLPKQNLASEAPWVGKEKYFLPVVLAITFLAFIPSLQNKFVNLDDPQYLTTNPVVQTLNSENLKIIFSEQFVGNYQPLTMLSYMIEHKLWGLNPFGYHFTNLLLHLLNTALVFLIIKKLISTRLGEKGQGGEIAFITALLFGIHPLHVESVAWVAERKDVLYGFFFLWALYEYVRPSPASPPLRGGFRWGLIVLLFSISLLSKAQAVVLPMVFFTIDFLQNRKFTKQTILEKVPFFALAVAFGILAIKVQGKAGAMQTFQYFPFYERILFSCYALMTYLHKLILPINLSCFYPYPETDDKINTIWVYLSPAVLLALAFVIWKYFRESKVALFGVGFFLLTIVLVLQLLPIGDALYADRYTYIPSIGLFFIVAYYARPDRVSNPVRSLGIIYLLFLFYLTFQRTKVWHDSITLYSDAIDNGYKAAILYNNRGAVLSDSTRNEEALKDFASLVALKPRYPNGWRNKGLIHVRLKQQEEGIHAFTEAIKNSPTDPSNYLSRGTIYVERNEFDNAILDFSKMVEMNPQSGEGYYARSEAYGKSGKLTDALTDINKAIELSPDNGQAYNNRGIINSMSGKLQEAINDFTRSLELKPDNYSAYTNRALAYKGLGKYAEALQDMQTAKEKGVAVDENTVQEWRRLSGK